MARHLTFQEREFLYRLKKQGKSKREIAELMGRDRTTVYRELSRNAGQRGYRPKQAQRLADERRLASRRPHKLADSQMHEYVEERLEKRWSPDQIAARSRLGRKKGSQLEWHLNFRNSLQFTRYRRYDLDAISAETCRRLRSLFRTSSNRGSQRFTTGIRASGSIDATALLQR
jgi:IS30 family transposase